MTCRYLYNRYILDIYSAIHFGRHPGPSHTVSLARTLLRRPDRAFAVRKVVLLAWSKMPSTYRGEDMSNEDWFLNLVSHLSSSGRERDVWMQDLRDGCDDAWIALLLTQMLNVQELIIHLAPNTKHVIRVLHQAAIGDKPFDTILCLPLLNRMSIWLYPSTIPRLVRPLLLFPGLKTISMHQITFPGYRVRSRELDIPPLKKRRLDRLLTERGLAFEHLSLELNSAAPWSACLITLLRAGKGLKSLRFVDNHKHHGPYTTNLFELFHTMTVYMSSIESLWLEFNTRLPRFGGARPLKSLQRFTGLKRLWISIRYLLNLDDTYSRPLRSLLPGQLLGLSLCLSKGTPLGALARHLEDYIRDARDLRELTIESRSSLSRSPELEIYANEETDSSEVERLSAECMERDIRFQLCYVYQNDPPRTEWDCYFAPRFTVPVVP